MYSITEFDQPMGNVLAAYNSTELPEEVDFYGIDGNALVGTTPDGKIVVVSCPRCEGEITEHLSKQEVNSLQQVDLSWAF